jgi:outer membrane biosynthesis protein TonB
MKFKRWTVLAVFAFVVLLANAGCGRVSLLAQGQPTTAPATRTPRPTFTPRSEFTNTPAATATAEVTDTPEATETNPPPTAKPVVVATAKPKPTLPKPTQPPVPTQPPAPSATAKPAFQYSFVGPVHCEHSGGVYIQIIVYSNYHDPNSQQPGVKVRASWAPDQPPLGGTDLVTDAYGQAQYTLQTQLPAKVATYYAWVIDSKGNRISELSAPIDINNQGADATSPPPCQLAKVFFAAGK